MPILKKPLQRASIFFSFCRLSTRLPGHMPQFSMGAMSPVSLVRFVLGEACQSDKQALKILDQALLSETEPLIYFSIYYKISDRVIYARAAQWCGLAYSDVVPSQVPTNPKIVHVDALAHVKTLRAKIFDRDVLFTSAGFVELVRIREQLLVQPELKTKICLVPPKGIRDGLCQRSAPLLMQEARTRLARQWPFASAHLELGMAMRLLFALSLTLFVVIAALVPHYLQPVLVPLLAFVLLVPALFRLTAALMSLSESDGTKEVTSFSSQDVPAYDLSPHELPKYTILIPLRDEAAMVPQLVGAMNRLDYPREKLDIKFVVESASEATIEAIEPFLTDQAYEMVVVPEQAPLTKPKALNYALPMARGEFVVIYDAEDIPEPDQLKRAIARFYDQPGLDCLQAELVIDNADENWISALFCSEYGGLFGLVLPSLSRWKMPLPLGGTSNHFRLQSLREVGGWDAFNVTEDADLGIRLSRLRYNTGTFTSRTYEEAPISIKSWMAQRTRWIKGWMQTFIVHNRHPIQFRRDIGWRNFLIFQAFVGGMILSAPLHSVFLLVLLGKIIFTQSTGLFPNDIWTFVQVSILVIGYGSAVIVATLGLKRLGLERLWPYLFLLPFYWVLNSLAAIIAIYELFTRPYFWAKTRHGVTRYARGTNINEK